VEQEENQTRRPPFFYGKERKINYSGRIRAQNSKGKKWNLLMRRKLLHK
jgi:hypothetical protein